MKKKLLLLTSLLVSISLSACGSMSKSADYAPAEAFRDYDDYGYEAAASAEEYYSDDIYEMSEPAAKVSSEEATNDSASDSQLESQSNRRKLIRTVNMSAQTKEFDSLIATVSERIDSLGGYAETMEISGYEYNASATSVRHAYIVARIPAQKLDSFINSVAENSNITSKNESTNDVTLEYTDVEAHRNSLRVEQERLNELLENADSLETIIALEGRLTEVRYELESYESRLRNIDNKVDYSTIYLDVSEVKDYTPVITEDPSFGQRIAEGFIEGCAGAAEGLGDFIVGLVTFLPGLLVFLIILGIIVLIIFAIVKLIISIVKKTNGKRKEKKIKNKKTVTTVPTVQQSAEVENTATGEENATK